MAMTAGDVVRTTPSARAALVSVRRFVVLHRRLTALRTNVAQKISNIKGDWYRQVTLDTPFLLTALENDMAAAEANMELLMISCNDPPSPAIPSPSSGVELLVATNADLQELLPHWVPDNSLDDESSHVKSKKQRRLGDKE